MSKGAEISTATKSFLFSYEDMDKMKDIMAKRGIVSLCDSLTFLCDHGCTTMFKRMLLGVSTSSFPFDTCDILSVVSAALKADNIDILAFILEFEGVSVDIFQSCSLEWWNESSHKDLCMEIVRDKASYPIHVALRRLLSQEELLDIIRSHTSSVCTVDYLGQTAFDAAVASKTSTIVLSEILHSSCTRMLASRDQVLYCRALPKHGFTSFRLHVGGITKGKVYFEYIVESDAKDAFPQIGINYTNRRINQ